MMKIFEIAARLADNFGITKRIGPLIDDPKIYRSLRSLLVEKGNTVVTPYSQSVWVYACINAIAQNLSRVPFVLKKDAGDLEPSIIEKGPLYDVMMKPNPLMTLKTLIEATFVYYCLRGEAFWILSRNNISEIPSEIWCFDPIRFEPVLSRTTGLPEFWKYRGKEEFRFFPHEIIQFKMFNPYDDLRGISPIEASRISIEADFQSSVFNRAFFEHGAGIGGFISIDGELTDEQFNRLIGQFEERHKGASKAHKIAVVEGGGKFTEAKLTQREMDFIKGKSMTRKEILATFKVNEVVLGIYDDIKSYEGIRAAHKAFWEECLMPKIAYFEEVLWVNFFSNIGIRRGKGRVWGEFDLANVGPIQINFSEKVLTASKMFTMGWPINHINKRLQLGMKEVPWGDEWWVPGGYAPVTALLDGTMPTTAPKLTEPKKPKEPEKVEAPKDTEDLQLRAKAETDLKNKFKKFLFEQRKRALKIAYSDKDWEELKDVEEYVGLKKELMPIYKDAVDMGIFFIQQQMMGELIPLDALSKDVTFHVESRATLVAEGFRNLINTALSTINKEKSDDVVADKVREIYNAITSKGNVIAKSEAMSAFSYGRSLAESYVRQELAPFLLGDKDEGLIDGQED